MTARQRQADPPERLAQLAADAETGTPSGDGFLDDVGAPEGADSQEIRVEAAAAAINGLASTWSIYRLYPNPVDQPGFRQAIENMNNIGAGRITIEVGAGSLAIGDTTLDSERGAVENLATRLFIHDVDRITISSNPDPQELCQLFGLLVLDRAGAEAMGGLGNLGESLKTFQISLRGLLSRDEEDEGSADHDEGDRMPARKTEIACLIDEGANADDIHAKLVAVSKGDDDKLRIEFVGSFREVHAGAMTSTTSASLGDMLMPYTVDDIGPSPTGTFIEVYFRLPERTRAEILEAFLVSTTDDESRMFLDQFSGDELAELVPNISDEGFAALVEYARATTEATGDDEELLNLLRSAREVRSLRAETGSRIGDLLAELAIAPATDLGEMLREQLAPDHHVDYGVRVVRALFATVVDDQRFARLVDVWAGRVRDRLHRGRVDEATAMLRAILDDPPFPESRAGVVDGVLAALMTPQLTMEATSLATGESRDQIIELMLMLGSPAVRRVLERLAVEEDTAARRSLIDLLAVLARDNPTPLLTSLSDDRWYVVRNVVAVLAKTGLPLAAEPIRQATAHADPRVRLEALRGLVRLDSREATPSVLNALGDPEERVRSGAVGLLRSLEGGTFEKRLQVILASGALPHSTLVGIAQHLVDHVPDSLADMRALATRRFVLKPARRAGRSAARRALRNDNG
ncbi:MAG: HEAT repeat domain-containing protein [Acidimicrobiia bacterium]